VVPTSVHKPQKTPKWLQNEGENSKIRPLFVEGVLWLNYGVLVGCSQNCAKKGQKILKVSFHAQNQQKNNPACVGSVPGTETGKNEVSKHTTEEVHQANPDVLLFENQKNSWSTISWSLYKKARKHMSVVVKCTCEEAWHLGTRGWMAELV
jgi:hypothetical protein